LCTNPYIIPKDKIRIRKTQKQLVKRSYEQPKKFLWHVASAAATTGAVLLLLLVVVVVVAVVVVVVVVVVPVPVAARSKA
jgi:fatty acid desaturase